MRALGIVLGVVFVLLCTQAGLALSYTSPTPPACGKYVLHTWSDELGNPIDYSCQRFGTFPWFAAQKVGNKQVWMTQITIAAGAQGGAQFEINLGANRTTEGVMGGNWSPTIADQLVTPLQKGGSDVLSLESAGGCTVSETGYTCGPTGELATGSIDVRISAPDVASLEAAYAQLVYISFQDGNVASWQVAVPLVFKDQAARKWSTAFTETPLNLKSGNMRANNTSFAVVNLADVPQSVVVSVYDVQGGLVAQQTTPELAAGEHSGFHNEEVYVGGVYARVLSDLLGNSIPAGDSSGADFRGTIRLEGSTGRNIAPVVLRAVGNSITSLILKPE
jgi:hypothetical protein